VQKVIEEKDEEAKSII